MGTGGGALTLGVKRPGCEANHSLPSNSEVNNAWSHASTPQYAFMAWCLVKHRDNFTFYLYIYKVYTEMLGYKLMNCKI
jgi:hypothetical protein